MANPQVKRNGPCPCGSGIKTKKCCWAKQQTQEAQQRLQYHAEAAERAKAAQYRQDMHIPAPVLAGAAAVGAAPAPAYYLAGRMMPGIAGILALHEASGRRGRRRSYGSR